MENPRKKIRWNPAEWHAGIRILLCVIPILLILYLGTRLAGQLREGGKPAGPGLSYNAAEAGIDIRLKNTEEQEGPLRNVQTIEVETIEDGLRDMGFLITEEYYFTEMLTNKKAKSLFGVELGFTEESYVVSYEGYITAGIDFTDVSISCDEESKIIEVSLPEAVIKDTVVDPESLQVYSEKKSVFNDFTEEERNRALISFEEDVRQKAEAKGILTRADRNAELVIRNFILGFAGQDYQIKFEGRP